MIEIKEGNLLEADAEAIVNTVNCVGVMGKGIALEFKQAYPENFRQYSKACRAGEVQPGRMFVVSSGNLFNPRYIINFPTKRHWRGKSKIEDIQTGLKALIQEVKQLGITSIAVPPLGCGNGGLAWKTVKPLIEAAFSELPNVQVLLFEPQATPQADSMLVASEKPHMTRARALFISLLELYGIPGYRLTMLEIQKLAYFLQVAGEPLRLQYVKGKYGPYANNLNHVLQKLEGHYIRGYGDRSREAQLYVLSEGKIAAREFLDNAADANVRLERVSALINGFETPYGMELLATVHWVVSENREAAEDSARAIELVREWNIRKSELFKPQHIRKAWQRLREQSWFV
ncbi:macro domain-containing protein [Microcoleus sp. ARI1-B5]|uniref:type II toxin-antitoxin system antitoxin DNA ADP-ribosyl glycohydrolase DarG n=1 Tax=unclassified Microcoleus TaxID=2642155 RepID=UPI002FD52BA3